MKGRLIKWDAAVTGDTPPHVEINEDPSVHPGCIEVIEMHEGELPRTVYRRDDDATDDSRRPVPR